MCLAAGEVNDAQEHPEPAKNLVRWYQLSAREPAAERPVAHTSFLTKPLTPFRKD